MNISTSALIIDLLQLFLLIASVYLTAIIKQRCSYRISVIDILILLVQVLNLALLPRYIFERSGFFTTGGGIELFLPAQGLLVLLLLIRFAWLGRRVLPHRQQIYLPQSIRETVDHLPSGLCFSTPSGRPILVNYRMNDLIYRLTGHTIMNAQIAWEELRQLDSANGYVKLRNLWLNNERPDECFDERPDECFDERLLFIQIDGYIWKFSKEVIADSVSEYTQIESAEISELYRNTEKLYEINEKLTKQHERLQDLLANIMEINHEKEILSAKMRIHDDLGRSILTTKQHLSNNTFSEGVPYLTELWSSTIKRLTDFTLIDSRIDISPEVELQKAAEMIGCRINIIGDQPADRKSVLLFFAAVREALTNAVKHAHADQLYVSIIPKGRGYHIEISDNGTAQVSTVTEGSGLTNLRQRLELEGATLQVKCNDGVVIIAELPA